MGPFTFLTEPTCADRLLTSGLCLAVFASAMFGCGGSDREAPAESSSPAGTIVDGIRVMNVAATPPLGDITVYRGETIKLIFAPTPVARELLIPTYEIRESPEAGESFALQFKAEDEGRFPIYCSADGSGPAQETPDNLCGHVNVIPFSGSAEARFTELSARESFSLIQNEEPLILDVRTELEFRRGHLENAVLIPVQDLANRLEELADARNRKVLIYCRSGNRSTVAGEILMRNGFTDLYNLRYGIREWEREGLPISGE